MKWRFVLCIFCGQWTRTYGPPAAMGVWGCGDTECKMSGMVGGGEKLRIALLAAEVEVR